MEIKFGDVFNSTYFKSKGVVVNYVSDAEWYFVLETHPYYTLRAKVEPEKVEWLRREIV